MYGAPAFAPLFVSCLIATLVCPKYPERGYCILHHVTRQRIKKKTLKNSSTDAQTAAKDKTFSAQT